jgi:hypothetical protein
MTKKLTIKQKKFIDEYVANNGNGTQAIIKAYPNVTYDSARMMASDNLSKPNIQDALHESMISNGVDVPWIIDKLKSQIAQSSQDKQHGSAIKGTKLLADFLGLTHEARNVDRLANNEVRQTNNLTEAECMVLLAIHDQIGMQGMREILSILGPSDIQ